MGRERPRERFIFPLYTPLIPAPPIYICLRHGYNRSYCYTKRREVRTSWGDKKRRKRENKKKKKRKTKKDVLRLSYIQKKEVRERDPTGKKKEKEKENNPQSYTSSLHPFFSRSRSISLPFGVDNK